MMTSKRQTHLYGGTKMSLRLQHSVFSGVLLLLLYLLTVEIITSDASVITSIDLTTNYTPLSKTVNSTLAAKRHAQVKLIKPSSSLSSLSSSSSSSTIANLTNSDLTDSRQQLLSQQEQENQQPNNLMVISAKSYVTQGSSTSRPITLKRMDIKLKKPIHPLTFNGSKEIEKNAKLKLETTDHVPDSSGYIPYRIGNPLSPVSPLPPPQLPPYVQADYDTTGDSPPTSKGQSIPYHGSPYNADKWHAEYWERDNNKPYYSNNTKVHHIEAECQDDFMKIRIGFNGSFNGLVYSAGYAYDPDCIYINGSGRDYYEFFIQLNRCGTLGKNSLHDDNIKNPTNFMWNTVTVQYNPLIEEEYDEHFKVTCEYGYDFWKTVTFPFLDVENINEYNSQRRVATGNPVVFTLSPPECYMEIQNGYGVGGPRVVGPVRVGDPLTLVIYMRSKYDGFDIVVNDCYAHNGAHKRIQLIDQNGCPVDDKLISRFRGSWSDTGLFETQVYAYMKTFRFTGSPALYIECDVRMCHGRCPSQPCHWRNLKAVKKREIDVNIGNITSTLGAEHFLDMTERPMAVSLSENVSLFQSLRVLKDGETDENYYDELYGQHQQQNSQMNIMSETCLKTVTFSAIITTLSMLLCISFAILLITCSQMKRQRKKPSTIYDYYVTRKGQID